VLRPSPTRTGDVSFSRIQLCERSLGIGKIVLTLRRRANRRIARFSRSSHAVLFFEKACRIST
jgi:hypothetical protein